jgi:hypothetical protein
MKQKIGKKTKHFCGRWGWLCPPSPISMSVISVADPYSFDTDTDTDPDPGFLMTKKFTAVKKEFWIKTRIDLSQDSVKDVQATAQHSKEKIFWVIFALLDPDPVTDPLTGLNPDSDPKHCL